MTTTEQFKVLRVYQQIKGKDGLTLEGGQQVALCFKGRKHMVCISAGHPIRVLKRDVRDFDKLREVLHEGKAYPVARAVETYTEMATRTGITAGAQKILDRAAGAVAAQLDEDEFDNEEELTMSRNENPAPVPASDGEAAATDESTNTEENATVSAKKKSAKKAAKPKAAAKKAAGPKKDKGPSRISQAVEFMKAEVKKEGGQKNLERGWRKELFERTAKKFGLKASTCGIQYNRNVLK
jgi:hypothetical protein